MSNNSEKNEREDIDVDHFKKMLGEEREGLLKELESVGRVNPDNSKDWESTQPDLNITNADRNEVADKIEAYEENAAILNDLEKRLAFINHALKKIESGRYGICEISGEPIEKERLEANPAARANIENRNKEEELPF
jgi:DnaK suppressor protein